MDREHYLTELRARLSGRLSPRELENVMAYYTEYFDEAGPEREGAVINELGAPERLTRVVMGEQVLEELERPPSGEGESEQPRRQGLGALWTVLLAIGAAPIAIPLAVAAVAVVVALAIAVLTMAVGVGAAGLACVAAGIVAAFCGFSVLFSAGITTTIYFVGIGLVSSGVGLLLMAGVFCLASLCLKGIIRMVGGLLHRRGARA